MRVTKWEIFLRDKSRVSCSTESGGPTTAGELIVFLKGLLETQKLPMNMICLGDAAFQFWNIEYVRKATD